MVILKTRNKITDFLMLLAWASPFKIKQLHILMFNPFTTEARFDVLNAMAFSTSKRASVVKGLIKGLTL